MTTETDIYGMSAEERAAFEQWAFPENLDREFNDGVFLAPTTNIAAITWAACAKLYRERLAEASEHCRAADEMHHRMKLRIKDLEKANQQRDLELLALPDIAELEAEVERLRADAARYAFLRELSEAVADFLRRG